MRKGEGEKILVRRFRDGGYDVSRLVSPLGFFHFLSRDSVIVIPSYYSVGLHFSTLTVSIWACLCCCRFFFYVHVFEIVLVERSKTGVTWGSVYYFWTRDRGICRKTCCRCIYKGKLESESMVQRAQPVAAQESHAIRRWRSSS